MARFKDNEVVTSAREALVDEPDFSRDRRGGQQIGGDLRRAIQALEGARPAGRAARLLRLLLPARKPRHSAGVHVPAARCGSQGYFGGTFLYAGLRFSAAALVLVKPRLGRFYNRPRGFQPPPIGGPPGPDSGGSNGDLVTTALASARQGLRTETTTMHVNGKRVDLDTDEQPAVRQVVADGMGGESSDPEPQRSIGERLQESEVLYRAGRIIRAEHAAGRARIISEI